MKKFLSVIAAAAITASAVTVPGAFAADNGIDIVLFGDSIASGYGLSKSEYNYGQLIADYTGGSVSNYAVAGATTSDTLTLLKGLSDAQATQVKDAEYVIVSTGANDMIRYSAKYMLAFCEEIGALRDGYTADNLPNDLDITSMYEIIDLDYLKAYANGSFANQLKINTAIAKLRGQLTITSKDKNYQNYDRVIETQVIPNIEQISKEIKAINPDTKVIVQTIYNPTQFQPGFLESNYPESYLAVMNAITPVFMSASDSFREQLSAVEGIEIADVYASFSSTKGTGSDKQEYGWYFTKIQDVNKDQDIHPTQAGHVAIAATVLNTMGESGKSGDLLKNTYLTLSNRGGYPAYAKAELAKLVDLGLLGDVNADGSVDAADASLILAEYAARSTSGGFFKLEQVETGDINGDNSIDAGDASVVLQFYAYLSTSGVDTDMVTWLASN